MSSRLISKKTVHEFFTWMKDNWVMRTIEVAFDDAGIERGEIPPHAPSYSSQRYTLASEFCASLDLTNSADAQKLLRVFEAILQDLDDRMEVPVGRMVLARDVEIADEQRARLVRCLDRDGSFTYEDGAITSAAAAPSLGKLGDITEALDARMIRLQVRRITDNVESDPDFAIGTSKELLETTCKTILGQRGVQIEKSWDLPQLVKAVRKELSLLPDDIPDSAKGARSIKNLLSALGTVAQGIAEVRNLYGTGHGKDGSARGLSPRHARLIAGCATTLASFLFETHEERG